MKVNQRNIDEELLTIWTRKRLILNVMKYDGNWSKELNMKIIKQLIPAKNDPSIIERVWNESIWK